MPFCMYDLSISRRKHDWLVWFPRESLENIVYIPYKRYYDCVEVLNGQTIESFIWNMWRKLRVNMFDDPTLSAILTRKDKNNMPSNMGHLLQNYSNISHDPIPYKEMTCKNQYVENND